MQAEVSLMKRKRHRLLILVLGIVCAALFLVPSAVAAPGGQGNGKGGGQGGGRGNGGGGGGGGETAANNLSVPALFVPSTTGAPTLSSDCADGPVDPTGTPLTGYEIAPSNYYYVQGLHTWQASCDNASSATVDAAWGDNIAGGDARLKVGSPIRVEMGLLAQNPTTFGMTGYTVDKLEPSELDRVSAYGTQASGSATDSSPAAKTTPYDEVRVWDAGAHLTVTNDATGVAVFDGPATAEINATGRIVYGYNLRVPTAGDYTITFTTTPAVTISSEIHGLPTTAHTATITITVAQGGGNGGGGGNPH